MPKCRRIEDWIISFDESSESILRLLDADLLVFSYDQLS